MKNTIVLFIILTTYLFSQGWNTTVPTTISEPNLVKMDLFSNKDGNHLVVQNSNSSNSIKYYLLNSSGTVVRSSTIETAVGAEFPNVSGDNDKVYLVYKLGSNLKANYSTNAGQSWNTVTSKAIGSNTCNGVDIVYDYQGLHVVYAMRDNYENYETYYYKLNSSNSWVDYKNVTDYNVDEVGGYPTVTVSSNRVHVSYNSGYSQNPGNQGDAKTRDKNGSTWENPQIVSSGANNLSSAEKVQVKSTTLFDFYYLFVGGGGNFGNNLMVKTRSTSGTIWSSATELGYNVNITSFMGAETTSDQSLHIIYYDDDNLYHRTYASSWSSTYSITSYPNTPYYTGIGWSKSSNDLFCTWKPSNSNLLSFRQYDVAPLAPQNLTAQATADYHPKLIWNNNTEADIQKYYVYRSTYNGGYTTPIATVTHNNATSTQSYIDNAITVPRPGGQAGAKYYYVVSAVDIGQYVSGYSNYIEVTSAYLYWEKRIAENSAFTTDFSLDQNYPNPFNPSTKISYSIKEEGLVTLKIYDILGKEIATLVNENKPAGIYEAEFNASALPSGMYIYKIQSGQFSDVKKMLLTK